MHGFMKRVVFFAIVMHDAYVSFGDISEELQDFDVVHATARILKVLFTLLHLSRASARRHFRAYV